jgi:cysteine desulfurase
MGIACELAEAERPSEARRLLELRERLHAGIANRLPDIHLNGHPHDRLPGNLNLSFGGVDGEALLMAMRDVAVSSGAACSSTEPEPSHVLLAMGLDEDMARASLRFGLGRFTTAAEIDFTIDAVADAVQRLRRQSVAWTVQDGPQFDSAV